MGVVPNTLPENHSFLDHFYHSICFYYISQNTKTDRFAVKQTLRAEPQRCDPHSPPTSACMLQGAQHVIEPLEDVYTCLRLPSKDIYLNAPRIQ